METMLIKLKKYIFLITLFALLISGGEWLYERYIDNSIFVSLVFKSIYMFMPALSVLIIEKWNFKEIFSKYRIGFKNIVLSKTLKFLFYTAFLLPLFIILLTFLLGNVLGLPDFGKVIFSNEELDAKVLTTFPPIFSEWKYRFLIGLPVVMVSSLLSGITINLLFALGEEIGWRGFLENNIFIPRLKRALVIGMIWGMWHTPLILMGHNYGDHRILGILVMVIVCIVLSFFFSNALYQTKSLLVPAAMHGIINSFSQTFAADIFMKTGNPLLGAPMGLVFILSVLLVLLIDRIINHSSSK